MNRLLAALLRDGLGAVAVNQVRNSIKRLNGLIAYYAVAGIFGLAGLAFLYVALYEWLSRSLDRESAAAIICIANLLIVGLMLILRGAILRSGRAPARVQSAALPSPPLEAGIEIGRNLRRKLRRSTPTIVLAAGVIGLAIGLRPGILTMFDRSPRPRAPTANPKKR